MIRTAGGSSVLIRAVSFCCVPFEDSAHVGLIAKGFTSEAAAGGDS